MNSILIGKSMPLCFALIGEAGIRSDQWWAKCRSTMLSQIRQHFSDDDIDEKEMLRWFEEFQHKYCERRGHRHHHSHNHRWQ